MKHIDHDIVWAPPFSTQTKNVAQEKKEGPFVQKWQKPFHSPVAVETKILQEQKGDALENLPPNVYLLTMKKLSIFFLSFSLMFLGVCFFSSGLFLGLWMGGRSSPSYTASSLGGEEGQPNQHGQQASSQGGSSGHLGTVLGLAGTAFGGKTGRLLRAGRRASDRERRQQKEGQPRQQNFSPSQPLHQTQEGYATGANPSFVSNTETKNTKMPPSSSTTGLYAVQLGTFSSQKNAQDLMNRFQSDFISAYIVSAKDARSQSIFYVRVGQYDQFDTAVLAAQSLSEQRNISAVPVAIENDQDAPLFNER